MYLLSNRKIRFKEAKCMSLRIVLIFVLSYGFIVIANCKPEDEAFTNKLDSLENILNAENVVGEHKVDVLNELTQMYGYSDPERSLAFAQQALILSEEINYGTGQAIALKGIGIAYHFMDDYNQALQHYKKSLEVSLSIDYKLGVSTAYYNIGCIYDYTGSYDEALEYFLKSMKLREEIDDKKGEAYALIAVGNIYRTHKNYDEALKFYNEGLAINRELNLINEIAYALYSIGTVYEFTGNDEGALKYFTESFELQKQINERYGMVTSLRIIGNIHERRSDLDTALAYYNKSLDIAKEIKNRRGIIESSIALGKLYNKQNSYTMAGNYLNQALEISKEIEAKDLIMDSYYWISELNNLMNNYEQAYHYFKLYTEIKDSIFNEENNNQILRMQTQFETEKKEKENELLKEKEARNLETIKKQRITVISTSIGLLLVLTLVIIIYRSNIKSKKVNSLLFEKNQEINSQKEELTTTVENLEQTQNQLIHAAKMASLGQLTAGVAHELNNPINFIHGNISPLERDINELISILDKYDSEVERHKLHDQFRNVTALKEKLDYEYLKTEIHKLLDGIGEGTHRTSDIVKGLRNFSRIDEDQYIKADIHEVIDSTLTVLKNKLKDRIVVHKEYGELDLIECLPTKLGQVFMNIITNGTQAIKDEGDIFIKTTQIEKIVRISIKDTGQGMSNEVIRHIFEPFYTTKDVGQGTGLGLSISFGIIERHNGDIDVISEIGKGTEFIIQLPAIQSS